MSALFFFSGFLTILVSIPWVWGIVLSLRVLESGRALAFAAASSLAVHCVPLTIYFLVCLSPDIAYEMDLTGSWALAAHAIALVVVAATLFLCLLVSVKMVVTGRAQGDGSSA